jgi:uncharacterized protein
MDLTKLPVIDTHAHLFDIDYRPRDLSEILTLSLENPPPEQRRQTLIYKWFIKELSTYLDCKPQQNSIEEARAEKIKADYKGYLIDLFRNAGIEGLVVDVGYQPASVSLTEFSKIAPVKVKYLFRIETALDKIWQERNPFLKALEQFDEALEISMKMPDFIGLKSIIGYRTGLAVKRVREAEAMSAYESGDEKTVRDFFLSRALRFCRNHNLPLQLHTSFGESNNNLILNNPLLLKELLDDEEVKQQQIVLVHGGYPYTFETGYLCAMYPNLFCDVSEFVPLVPLGMNKGLADLMDMCPFNKIMYGSDAFIIPEFNWFAAVVFKRKLKTVLNDIISQGILDDDDAEAVAMMITHKNAKSFYGF